MKHHLKKPKERLIKFKRSKTKMKLGDKCNMIQKKIMKVKKQIRKNKEKLELEERQKNSLLIIDIKKGVFILILQRTQTSLTLKSTFNFLKICQ